MPPSDPLRTRAKAREGEQHHVCSGKNFSKMWNRTDQRRTGRCPHVCGRRVWRFRVPRHQHKFRRALVSSMRRARGIRPRRHDRIAQLYYHWISLHAVQDSKLSELGLVCRSSMQLYRPLEVLGRLLELRSRARPRLPSITAVGAEYHRPHELPGPPASTAP